MDKKTLGFAIMLLSLILMLGFEMLGWDYLFELPWHLVWMGTAVVGFILVVLDAKGRGKH